jgi:hypothetical protein
MAVAAQAAGTAAKPPRHRHSRPHVQESGGTGPEPKGEPESAPGGRNSAAAGALVGCPGGPATGGWHALARVLSHPESIRKSGLLYYPYMRTGGQWDAARAIACHPI